MYECDFRKEENTFSAWLIAFLSKSNDDTYNSKSSSLFLLEESREANRVVKINILKSKEPFFTLPWGCSQWDDFLGYAIPSSVWHYKIFPFLPILIFSELPCNYYITFNCVCLGYVCTASFCATWGCMSSQQAHWLRNQKHWKYSTTFHQINIVLLWEVSYYQGAWHGATQIRISILM